MTSLDGMTDWKIAAIAAAGGVAVGVGVGYLLSHQKNPTARSKYVCSWIRPMRPNGQRLPTHASRDTTIPPLRSIYCLLSCRRYPQFQGAAAIQNQLNTDAAKASAVHCGKLNRATLERSGLLGKLWPLT